MSKAELIYISPQKLSLFHTYFISSSSQLLGSNESTRYANVKTIFFMVEPKHISVSLAGNVVDTLS